jgi:hypothetical protein
MTMHVFPFKFALSWDFSVFPFIFAFFLLNLHCRGILAFFLLNLHCRGISTVLRNLYSAGDLDDRAI